MKTTTNAYYLVTYCDQCGEIHKDETCRYFDLCDLAELAAAWKIYFLSVVECRCPSMKRYWELEPVRAIYYSDENSAENDAGRAWLVSLAE